jgi:signal transduction histidine kinase
VPPAAQAHLFEAFAGSTRPGGTGLGLPIAREIMRAHGGDVELVHTGDDGTAFHLTLPAR